MSESFEDVQVRVGYKNLIYRGGGSVASHLEPLTTELLARLNEAIDIRGDRIATFRQRLFESLRAVSIITSILWLVPFYFLDYQVGIFGALLKLGVTLLIIFILSIIDDLDEPFEGYWRINTMSWQQILKETNFSINELQEKQNEARVHNRKKNQRIFSWLKLLEFLIKE